MNLDRADGAARKTVRRRSREQQHKRWLSACPKPAARFRVTQPPRWYDTRRLLGKSKHFTGVHMGLNERRKIKDLQDNTFPGRVKEIEEICGKAIPYDVDWESLADDAEAL